MILTWIRLKNFRNFQKKHIDFNPNLTIILGDNAQGKTNILEAIYFIVNGVGFRESKEAELLYFESKDHAEVSAEFRDGALKSPFKIVLIKRLEGPEAKVEKTFFVGKTKKGQAQYRQELTKAVLFTPQQIELLTGSPDRRREYFNKILILYDIEYKKRLDNYEKAVRRRNKILEGYTSIDKLENELLFWDAYLEKEASYITAKRQEYINFLNSHPSIDSKKFKIEYLKNEFTLKRVDETKRVELATRRTRVGPQKDDFQIELFGEIFKDIHKFGSRSEQRLTILWLKICEVLYCKTMTKRDPILLFDDIFSELDHKNRKLIFDLIKNYQTVLTTTEKEVLPLTKTQKSIVSI